MVTAIWVTVSTSVDPATSMESANQKQEEADEGELNDNGIEEMCRWEEGDRARQSEGVKLAQGSVRIAIVNRTLFQTDGFD